MTVAPPAEPILSRADKRFNFAACLTDAVGWPLSAAFLSQTTLLPLFLAHLGAGNTAIGALPALFNLLLFLPGLLVVSHLAKRRRARGFLFWVALLERLALVPLAVLTPLWAQNHPHWLLMTVFASFALHAGFMGLNQPAYWVVIGKCIPAHWRGRLFGVAGGIAGVLGLGLDRVLNHFLSGPHGGFPLGFARCFWTGFALMTVSFLPLGIVREPSFAPAADLPNASAWQSYLLVWRSDHGFRRFLYAQIALFASTLAAPFYILEAGRRLQAGPGAVAGYTATLLLTGSFGGLLWGAWADRSGNKVVLLACAACAILPAVFAPLAPTAALFYTVFALSALSTAGVALAANNIVMEYADSSRDIPRYTALYNAVTALPRALAPLLGGLLADHFGSFHPVFALSALLAALALALTLRAAEPRRLSPE